MADDTGAKNKVKVWKATTDSPAGFMITPDAAIMAGNSKNFIAADKNGVSIAGSLSLMMTSDQIRQGGLFIQMNDFVQMIPKTIVTPIPQIIPFPPVAFFASIATSMPMILALAV